MIMVIYYRVRVTSRLALNTFCFSAVRRCRKGYNYLLLYRVPLENTRNVFVLSRIIYERETHRYLPVPKVHYVQIYVLHMFSLNVRIRKTSFHTHNLINTDKVEKISSNQAFVGS